MIILPLTIIFAVSVGWIASKAPGAAAVELRRTRTFSPYIVQVRFNSSTVVSSSSSIDQASMIPDRIRSSIVKMERVFPFSDEVLDRLRSVAPNELPDLKQWMVLTISNPSKSSVDIIANELRKLSTFDVVNVITNRRKPPPLPISPKAAKGERNNTTGRIRRGRRTQATPDFRYLQQYLDPAPEGIDAKYMWTIPGGRGGKVKVYDIEYGWEQNHEDLSKAAGLSVLVPADFYYENDGPDHGTAVLGELVGNGYNGFGVTGIVPNAGLGLAANWVVDSFGDWYDKTAESILLSVADGKPGDVILLEAQTWVCTSPSGTCGSNQLGCGPVEWDDAVYDAILYAVANDIAVVEAAGNGVVNLDDARCNGKFDRTVRDSGAIIVGGGSAPTTYPPRSAMDYTSFGSRVDLQGYGEKVTTTGYGDLQNVGPTRLYTDSFGGTSSASPIVAGAVASVQSAAIHFLGKPLPPKLIRTVRKTYCFFGMYCFVFVFVFVSYFVKFISYTLFFVCVASS
jgi:Subtilase family